MSKFFSKRYLAMKGVVSDQLGVPDQAWTDCLAVDRNREMIENFLDGVGHPKLIIYYQLPDEQQEEFNHENVLMFSFGDSIRLKARAVYFIRNLPESKKTINLNETSDSELFWGELTQNPIKIMSVLMDAVYEPLINSEKNDFEWGLADQEAQEEFKNYSEKFKNELEEAINLMSPSQELFKLEKDQVDRVAKMSEDEKMAFYETTFERWIKKIDEMLLVDNEPKKEEMDVGPRTELEYWRTRMQRITNWSEQLKSADFVTVKNMLTKNKSSAEGKKEGQENISKLIINFNRLDLTLTDKLNEAKDNVKYLSTLEKFIDPLYNGSPEQIIETLPALMNAIKMIHTIARFYNTTDKMTGLFVKITNQMIKNCKDKIVPASTDKTGDIWKKDPAQMIVLLTSCIKLNKEYKDIYKMTKEKVADMPKGKTFDFSEIQIFSKFDQFVKRLRKIIDIFENIQQFNALNKHNLEGMEILTAKFNSIFDEFKKKRTSDLLNLHKSDFDRDYVQFNVDISKLDTEMQSFIDSCFNRFLNIEYSLKLLKKFENTLKRDALRHKLEQKYSTILHTYSTELDAISKIFQESRNDPPIVRNTPEVAGKIIWSRHLFQKITGPINMFPKSIVGNNEIKRYYSSYNSLGKQLTIHEMWYFMVWSNDIERSKAALQATLIVRNEKKMYVNFHPDIMQLIREAKVLDRQSIKIPESARIILLQEEKFKMYNNELMFLLKEHDRITGKIKPICKELLSPHIADLELKLYPGMSTLTWTSMNIDSFLAHVHQGLSKLEQLIINVNDIIENRIESNLKLISKVILVHLPEGDTTFTLEHFVNMQEDYINEKKSMMTAKNIEIERAVDDLIKAIMMYPLDPRVEEVKTEDIKKLQKYYFWFLYQSLLNATQNSLNAMKHRICGVKGSAAQKLNPFFEVDVQLEGGEVKLSPSLEAIQKAINKAATTVLRCSKNLYNWNKEEILEGKKTSLYDMIAQEREIVKVILLLTGSIQGTKNKVNDFLSKFIKYEWIWKQNVIKTVKEFQDEAQLQSYEVKLKQFTAIEGEIENIEPTFVIGAMVLKTGNLCNSMKQFCKEWKYHYSEDLHQKAKAELDNLTEQIKEIKEKLTKTKVKDIDSLGIVMEKLEEIRNMQTVIDIKFNPVLDMYTLLDSYLPPGNIDKDEMDHRSMLRRSWDSLVLESDQISNSLSIQQADYLRKLKANVKQLVKDVQEFRTDYERNGPMVEGIEPKEALERLKRFIEQYEVREQQYKINAKGEELFGLQKQRYPALEKTKAELANLRKLYDLYMDVINFINEFQECLWEYVSPPKLLEKEDAAKKYRDACQNLPRDLKEWQAYKELKNSIENMQALLPIITLLKKDSIEPRHWEALNEKTVIRIPHDTPDIFTIEDLIKAKVLDFTEDIEEIADSADKQRKIKNTINEMKNRWDSNEFEFANWGKRENSILKGISVQDLSEVLEEDQMTLSSINAQRHVAPFKKEVEEMIRNFSDCSEIIDLWVKVQKLWTSLEPVFTGGDIAKQMPVQAKMFIGIDKNWIRCMEKAFESKKVILCCQSEMLKESLPDMQKKLEECQKMLEAYLEGKRKQFPRFYFVSNPNLLKILSMGSEPNSIQEDFEKLFDAITRVEFGKDTEKKGSTVKVIKTIISELGSDLETVNLKTNVRCEGNIESWLNRLELAMQQSIHYLGSLASNACSEVPLGDAKEHIRLSENKLSHMLKSQISQISLMSIQLIWTTKMTEILEQKEKQSTRTESTKKGFVDYMMNVLTQLCLSDIDRAVERRKIETLVTIHVHQKDITDTLKNNTMVTDFDWQKQTRFYWKGEIDQCVVSITDFEQVYAYEFLGAKERLCVTLLTDRCYITLAQALSMYYGGAPAGPAGTGKTETVKDLGRSLGIFVMVTNCSDQHRYRDMAKIFKGLVQSGLWGCFDEFNRIDLDVLSVVAMQVESIGLAKRQNVSSFMFPEEVNPIKIIQTVGYFITMNPGYAGRQELPENLKVLFRGVTMMIPDREVIIKVKLASVGYESINSLSKKFNILYKLCEEQLSKQRHYDFGLRNILSVLRTAGNTKRAESKLFDNAGDKKDFIEEKLLMRSLRDINESKLVEDDQPLFADLLNDIFPKQLSVEKKVYKDVETQIPLMIKKRPELVNNPPFFKKIIQLYEQSLVRHGFMLIGVTGTGKTAIMNILTEVLSEINKPLKINRMNPKAITDKEMYGVKSEISDDWIPGVFSTIWLRANNRANKFITWITCDGPVDAVWIENLNTVLDDNKILTLANGERIPMTDHCKLVFEVENLNNASPATVSRCGQVFVSPGDLPINCIYEGWCELRKLERGAEEAQHLLKYLNKYFVQHDVTRTLSKAIKAPPVMQIETPIKVTNTINLINGILRTLPAGKFLPEKDYEKVVVFAMSWAIGGLYEYNERYQFQEYLMSIGAPLPSIKREKDTIFDFFVNIEDNKGEYKMIEVEKWKPPEKGNVKFSQLFLPTPDSWRADYLIRNILKQPRPIYSQTAVTLNAVLLVGGSGTAKTSSVLMYSSTFDIREQAFKRINFSSATSPFNFQGIIEAECDSKVGKNYAPPGGKTMCVFIDDMSMPFVNKWGDQVTLEIVRQLIEQSGFYWLDKAQRGNFKNIKGLSYIGAMNQPGGGRNNIPNRLKRHHFIFNMILPLSVEEIYGPIIKNQFRVDHRNSGLTEEVKKVIEGLTSASIKLWDLVKKYMLPTPSKFHYVFNMRELARIFKGILQIKKEIIMKSRRLDGVKPETFLVSLWRHECQRVFVDKLTNLKDKNQVEGYIEEIMTHHFNLESEVNNFVKGKNILFLDFMALDIRDEEGTISEYGAREYEGMARIDEIRKRCAIAIEDYNNELGSKAGKRLELVLFDDAISHLLRISRIIKMPRSSALLVGVGGSGKQSLTRLAAYIGRMETRQIVLAKNYGEKELREDIKEFFKQSGHLGKQTCFIMTDSEVKKEEFLEYINMILSTGEIAGLFAKDEREVIMADVRNDLVREKNDKNAEPTNSELYSYFVERTRDNLHLVLCFSPVGVKFRERSRKFPALFNECTIDWFLTWPEEALVSVAETDIRKFKELNCPEDVKQNLMRHMGNVHVIVRDICEEYFMKMRRLVYVTPKSYLSYLKSYVLLYKKKFAELDKSEENFTVGVRKIDEAAETIAAMKVSLKDEEALLKEATLKCEGILNNLHNEQKKAQIKEREVGITAASCEKQAN
jgi:dynein heavy chain